jgi:hypothetical protein
MLLFFYVHHGAVVPGMECQDLLNQLTFSDVTVLADFRDQIWQ